MKNKKFNITFFILALAYLAFSLRVVFAFVDYQMNYQFISQVLCVNKDRPEMECNGKCHLVKEMAKTNPDNEQDSNTLELLRLNFVEALGEKIDFEIIPGCVYQHAWLYNHNIMLVDKTIPTPPPQHG